MKIRTEKSILLTELLKSKIGCSMTKVKKKISQDDIFINGVLVCEHNPEVPAGSLVEIKAKAIIPKDNISILFEDEHIIAVEKPCGLLTNQSKNDKKDTLLFKVSNYLKTKSHGKTRAFIVHRLDQKVSGIVIFAKNKETESYLIKNWYKFEKTYHALVEGCPKEKQGKIESWLYEDRNLKVHSGAQREDSKQAITFYSVDQKFRQFSLIAVKLGTGRKNQIRVHMADLGCPIVGDFKYGASANSIGRIGLHAHTMKLIHPISSKELIIRCPTPQSFVRFK